MVSRRTSIIVVESWSDCSLSALRYLTPPYVPTTSYPQVMKSDLLVDNCAFQDCYASLKGGAIKLSIGNMTVENSLFWNTSVGGNNVEGGKNLVD